MSHPLLATWHIYHDKRVKPFNLQMQETAGVHVKVDNDGNIQVKLPASQLQI